MPDWLTHSLVGWMIGKTFQRDVSILMIGSLLPDLIKIQLAFTWTKTVHASFFTPLHTPIGSILIAGIIALFFIEAKSIFFLLSLGLCSHFLLDFFLVHVSGGMMLLFPLSWDEWQIYLIRSDNYWVTVVTLFCSLCFYLLYEMDKKKKLRTKNFE